MKHKNLIFLSLAAMMLLVGCRGGNGDPNQTEEPSVPQPVVTTISKEDSIRIFEDVWRQKRMDDSIQEQRRRSWYNKRHKSFDQQRVYLCYDNTINGFSVNVMLLPDTYNEGVTCEAVIDVSNADYHRQFLHPAFYLDSLSMLNFPKDTVVHLRYNAPKRKSQNKVELGDYSSVPFFFLDVDFDGREELVLTLSRQGQRGSDAFQACHLRYDYLYDNLREEPFNYMDINTEIDYNRLTITNYTHESASWGSYDIYKFEKSDWGSTLVSHITEEHRSHDNWQTSEKRTIRHKSDTTQWRAEKK